MKQQGSRISTKSSATTSTGFYPFAICFVRELAEFVRYEQSDQAQENIRN